MAKATKQRQARTTRASPTTKKRRGPRARLEVELLPTPGLQREASPAANPMLAAASDLSTFLSGLPAAALSKTDRLLLVDQALVLLESFYVHRPLKEAMHAVRPVQRLKLLQFRIEQTKPEELDSDLRFHNEMTEIFVSLRDLHTNYLLPAPYRGKIAFLPFLLESYFEGGRRKYLVSRLIGGFTHPTFVPGVEVLRWNGMTIERAVELNADRQAGSNLDARHARGLEAMTIRPLVISLPPDADFEIIGYRTADGSELELRQQWQVLTPAPGMGLTGETAGIGGDGAPAAAAAAQGVDIQTESVREAKRLFFAPHTLLPTVLIADDAPLGAGESTESLLPGVFKARSVMTSQGNFGYIRIFTFSVPDAGAFVQEFVRLASLLPQKGLIVDVRGNGGGLIWAGELLLQALTPKPIDPERLLFINTPLTLELCARHANDDFALGPWLESIRQSVTTGATYSRGFPITPRETANAIGQQYVGPVVLIIDALCYSTTDIFTAGFQDHEIGPILGVSGHTGAGGANVWTHELLQSLFAGPSSPLKPLPQGAGMRVAIRQTVRVGPEAGTLVEDLGVAPDALHQMTRDDLLNDNADLIEKAGSLLAAQPVFTLTLRQVSRTGNQVKVAIGTGGGIRRVDVFLGGRPQQSLDVTDGEVQVQLTAPTGRDCEVRGFTADRLVANRRLAL